MVSSVPMVTHVFPLTAADCAEMPYASALLLDSKFDASITDDPEFRGACETGFDAYFEEMYAWNEVGDDLVFVEKQYAWREVRTFVVRNAMAHDGRGELLPCGWRAGFVLGWLSALALTDRSVALRALSVVERLLTLHGKRRRWELVA